MSNGSEMTDAEKLLKLAQWFDVRDAQSGIADKREVQSDLRRIAARIIALETQLVELGEIAKAQSYTLTEAAHFAYGRISGGQEPPSAEFLRAQIASCGTRYTAHQLKYDGEP